MEGSDVRMTWGFQSKMEWINQLSQWLQDLAIQYGYLGIFVVSFIGAASVVFPIPYTLVIFYLGTLSFFNPLLIAVSGGAGSALGEFFGYFLGYYGRAALSEERQRKLSYVVKVFSRYGAIAIFIFALTPLPDDLLFIPLGIMRYPFLKAFIPSLAGKILMCLILAYGGRLSVDIIERFVGEEGGYLGIIFSTVLLIVVLVLLIKIDWEKILPLEGDEEDSEDQ
jgi:membrane protein DedA with SNARE-associated domain